MKKNAMKELDRDRKQETTVSAKSRPTPEIMRQTKNADSPMQNGASPMMKGRDLLYPSEGKKIVAPTTLSEVDMTGLSEDERKKMVSAIRREYQRQYYQKHKEKAKEYQRQYNLTHKKKVRGGRGKANFECPREKTRMTFNTADLMHSTSEKTLKMLKQILSGDRMFTM